MTAKKTTTKHTTKATETVKSTANKVVDTATKTADKIEDAVEKNVEVAKEKVAEATAKAKDLVNEGTAKLEEAMDKIIDEDKAKALGSALMDRVRNAGLKQWIALVLGVVSLIWSITILDTLVFGAILLVIAIFLFNMFFSKKH